MTHDEKLTDMALRRDGICFASSKDGQVIWLYWADFVFLALVNNTKNKKAERYDHESPAELAETFDKELVEVNADQLKQAMQNHLKIRQKQADDVREWLEGLK